MKRTHLFLMIALAVGSVTAAHAQNTQNTQNIPDSNQSTMSNDSMNQGSSSDSGYDGRWYLAPTVGGYYNDTDRNTSSRQVYYGLGFGKFVSPNASFDVFFDSTSRQEDRRPGWAGRWFNNNVGVAGRFYAGDWNAWRPYALVSAMGSYHNDSGDKSWSPAAEVGVGLSKTLSKNFDFRVEGGYRYDFDNGSQTSSNNPDGSHNGYGDWLLGVSLVARLGQPPAPPPAPAAAPAPPPKPTCDQLDSDNDGVNNCDDKCPNTASGTIVGPDGCQQKVVIDLRGVNFKFDRPKPNETDIAPTLQEPTSQSMSILDQAVDTLKRYPQVKVEVAGYTDSIGTASYNQKLSQRRAKIVYDYLTSHGISEDRLEGPVGHGENNPIDTNSTKAGRARNRRTELQVQNDNVQNNGGMQDNSDSNDDNSGM